MASIKERRSTFSVVYWYVNEEGVRKQKWDTCKTKKEAKIRKAFVELYQQEHGFVLVPLKEQFKEEKEQAIEKIENPNAEITVKEFLEIFVNIYGTAKWSVSTYSGKMSLINNYINPLIGDWKLSDLTTKNISQFYNDLLKVKEVERSNRTATGNYLQPAGIKKIHDIIRCALNNAIRWEYIDPSKRNPATLATLPKIHKVRRKVWSAETFKYALSVVEDPTLELAMNLSFACSMRIGEISGLLWSDVVIDDLSIENDNAHLVINKELTRCTVEAMEKLNQKDIIKVFPTFKPRSTTRLVLKTPKTESSKRTVWIPKTIAMLLRKYKQEQDELKEFLGDVYYDHNLVLALDNGNPVESKIIRDRFQDLYTQYELEPVVFHSLRHLSTSYKLKMTNGDIKSVQGDTGHAEVEMVTEVYSRIIDEDRKMNAKKLDESFYAINKAEEHDQENKKESLLDILKNLTSSDRELLLSLANLANK